MDTLDEIVNSGEANLNVKARTHLKTASLWAKFVGIVLFIFTGLVFTACVFMFINAAGSSYGNDEMLMLGVTYLISSVLYFFVAKFVFDFGRHTKRGIKNNSQEAVEKGIKGLKNHFVLMGVLMIIGLALMFIMMIFIAMLSSIRF